MHDFRVRMNKFGTPFPLDGNYCDKERGHFSAVHLIVILKLPSQSLVLRHAHIKRNHRSDWKTTYRDA